MADVAAAAGVSKPLLYHYFPTRRELYVATVAAAAEELRVATRADETLPQGERARRALAAHVAWIDEHGAAYRAILQGGISSDPDIRAIVESSRAQVVERLTEAFGFEALTPARRIALRGWIGFLEGACLDWLADHPVSPAELVGLLAASLSGVARAAAAEALLVDG